MSGEPSSDRAATTTRSEFAGEVAVGARVHSFDCDPQSVACTAELKRQYFRADAWRVEQGSVLDAGYLRSLGRFDIVYSWGVRHHTGA